MMVARENSKRTGTVEASGTRRAQTNGHASHPVAPQKFSRQAVLAASAVSLTAGFFTACGPGVRSLPGTSAQVTALVGQEDMDRMDSETLEQEGLYSLARATAYRGRFRDADRDGAPDNLDKSLAHCTAAHLGNGIVITAGHCAFGEHEIKNSLSCSDEEGKVMAFRFGRVYRDALEGEFGAESFLDETTYTCQEILVSQNESREDLQLEEIADPTLRNLLQKIRMRKSNNASERFGLDYALIRVSPIPPARVLYTYDQPRGAVFAPPQFDHARPGLDLRAQPVARGEGDEQIILHHRNGRALHRSKCRSLDIKLIDEWMWDRSSLVRFAAGYATPESDRAILAIDKRVIGHECDTQKGSSGSGMYVRRGSGYVLHALHQGFSEQAGLNLATTLSSIKSVIQPVLDREGIYPVRL